MKKIGIVGGGQLGRMLSLAATKLGFHVTVLDPTPNSPAGQVANLQIVGSFKDPESIRKLAQDVDYITFEIESAHADTLKELKKEGKQIHPSPETLIIIKDKFGQKEFLREEGIPVAEALAVNSEQDIEKAIKKFGLPFLLKTRFDAYDGRGNALVKEREDIPLALEKLGGLKPNHLYIEKFVPFVKELSVVAARDMNGEVAAFPVVETIHKNNICHIVAAPAKVEERIKIKTKLIASKVLNVLDGVGVFGIEMFVTEDEEVLVNEIAPRVHNSGHHTIEACETSQFEQHIRAITGMQLGNPELKVPASVMINILGERSGPAEVQGLEEALMLGGTAVHVYGKLETRPERKMGHITVFADSPEEALEKALKARTLISI